MRNGPASAGPWIPVDRRDVTRASGPSCTRDIVQESPTRASRAAFWRPSDIHRRGIYTPAYQPGTGNTPWLH